MDALNRLLNKFFRQPPRVSVRLSGRSPTVMTQNKAIFWFNFVLLLCGNVPRVRVAIEKVFYFYFLFFIKMCRLCEIRSCVENFDHSLWMNTRKMRACCLLSHTVCCCLFFSQLFSSGMVICRMLFGQIVGVRWVPPVFEVSKALYINVREPHRPTAHHGWESGIKGHQNGATDLSVDQNTTLITFRLDDLMVHGGKAIGGQELYTGFLAHFSCE